MLPVLPQKYLKKKSKNGKKGKNWRKGSKRMEVEDITYRSKGPWEKKRAGERIQVWGATPRRGVILRNMLPNEGQDVFLSRGQWQERKGVMNRGGDKEVLRSVREAN